MYKTYTTRSTFVRFAQIMTAKCGLALLRGMRRRRR